MPSHCSTRRRRGEGALNGWRIRTLTGETFRNLGAALARVVVIGMLVAGMIGTLTWTELTVTNDILAFHRGYIAAGGNVVVASHPQGLPAARCLALVARSEVVAAGTANPAPASDTNIAPGTFFQVQEVSAGALRVWGAEPGVEAALAGGLVMGSAAAAELGLGDGQYVAIEDDSPVVVKVVDLEGRSPQFQRSIFKPAAPLGRFATCWIETADGSVAGGEILLTDTFADSGEELSVNRWIRLGEFARNPIAELAGRAQAHVWLAVGAVITLLVWLDLWFRRGSLSLYRVLGTSRTGLLYAAQLETAVIVVVAGVLGYMWAAAVYGAVALASPTEEQYLVAARTGLSAILVPIIIGPLPALLTGARNGLLNQLKER